MNASQIRKTRQAVGRVRELVSRQRGVSVRTVRRWARNGDPRAKPLTGEERQLVEELDGLLKEVSAAPGAPTPETV